MDQNDHSKTIKSDGNEWTSISNRWKKIMRKMEMTLTTVESV